MVDTLVLGTSTLLCVGSTPTFGTMKLNVYAVIITVGSVIYGMIVINTGHTTNTNLNDSIIKRDTFFSHNRYL